VLTFAPWFWPAICAWLCASGAAFTVLTVLGYRAETRRRQAAATPDSAAPTTAPEEGTHR
jgi:hypothetical protein